MRSSAAASIGPTMRRRISLLCLCLLLRSAGALGAEATDPADLVFWRSIEQSSNPAEYQAYLDTFPNGRFAPLARLRAAASAVPAGLPAAALPSAAPPAWVRPSRTTLRLVDGLALDLDATPLRDSSNLRLAVVAATAPDAVTDPNAFVEDTTPVKAMRLHLTVPPGPPGADEVRLYHIAQYATAFTVAARAPVTVQPGAAGAVLARDLAREAARIGPLRFEAAHRDRPVLVEAAFLRVRPSTEWNRLWFGNGLTEEVARRTAIISIGLPGVAPDFYGSLGEIVCLLAADDERSLDRIAALRTGDPVLVRGVPTSWTSANPADPILLNGCTLSG